MTASGERCISSRLLARVPTQPQIHHPARCESGKTLSWFFPLVTVVQVRQTSSSLMALWNWCIRINIRHETRSEEPMWTFRPQICEGLLRVACTLSCEMREHRVEMEDRYRQMSLMTLILANVTKEFNRRTIFRDISFSLAWGDSLAITGRNGSGKSTLVK